MFFHLNDLLFNGFPTKISLHKLIVHSVPLYQKKGAPENRSLPFYTIYSIHDDRQKLLVNQMKEILFRNPAKVYWDFNIFQLFCNCGTVICRSDQKLSNLIYITYTNEISEDFRFFNDPFLHFQANIQAA